MRFFDTSDYARKLQKEAFTEQQAEVQVDALRTLIENDLATKQDIASFQKELAELRKETQESIESLRKETICWFVQPENLSAYKVRYYTIWE